MRGRRQGLSWVILAILLLTCMTIQGGVRITKASPGKPAVNVDPRIIEIPPPETFNISISVTDIVYDPPFHNGLYQWEFLLEFDPSILEVTNFTMGLFLYEEAGWETLWQWGFVEPEWDNTIGFVSAGDGFMPDDWGELPGVGAIGSGLLATITFQIKAEGSSLLHLDETYLDTVIGEPPYQDFSPINHEAFDGLFEYPLKTHDIAVTHVTAFPLSIPVGDYVFVNATVENEGEVAETFDVKAYHNFSEPEWSLIGTITVTNLAPSDSETVGFSWKPSPFIHKGKFFIIKVEVSPIPGETDTADNTRVFDGKVFVGEAPEASFSYLPRPSIAGKNVTFDASASNDPDGTIVSYEWNFGDETPNITETDPIATHMYPEAGTYNVTLAVTDNHGFSDTATDGITVLAHDVAVASATASHIAVMPGVQVAINVTVVNEGDFPETFNVTAYCDDNPIATNTSCWETPLTSKDIRALTFTWNTTSVDLGPYTIKAVATTVTDEINTMNNMNNCTITIAPFNIVSHPVEVGGVIFYVVTESNSTVSNFQLVKVYKKTSFNVTGPDGTAGYCNVTVPKKLLSVNATHPWLVRLDDVNITDTTSIVENATHTFFYFTYNLGTRKVEIIGANLATPTPPVAIFTPSTTSSYVGDLITFNASASKDHDGEIVTYQWDFDDGTTKIYMKSVNLTDTATHNYTAAGNYTVTLTVTDDDSLTDTATTNMTISWIHDVAVTNLTVSPNTVKIGEPVYINVTVANEGDVTESLFVVKVYYDNSVFLGSFLTIRDLAPLAETAKNTQWNTKGVPAGKYTIKANATLDGDINPSNNERIYGTVTIEKLSSTISISASPTTMTLGENTTISGSISLIGEGVEEVDVTIQYRFSGEESWTNLPTVTTDGDSQYSYVWTPTTLGTYELKASWEGDVNTESAESDVITIEVVEIHDITLDVGGVSFHVVIKTNSTISNFKFIQADRKTSFNVTGPDGTAGYCNVTIPKDLLDAPPDQWIVLVDGESITPLVTHNATHTFLYFTYTLSTRKVEIRGVTIATPPIALFAPSTTSSYVGDSITFNASASYDPDGTIDRWDWDFDGDGVVDATGEIVEHAYSSAGNYTVTLTVTDDDSLADIATDTVTVTVQEAPALGILLYTAAAGAAAIIIVATAFYFLRARKQGAKDMLETEKSSKLINRM